MTVDDAAHRFPRLSYLLSAYFHQNWAAGYQGGREPATYQRLAADIRESESPAVVAGMVEDLDVVLGGNLAEADLRALSRTLGSQFSPPGAGTTYAQWYQDLRDILASPRAGRAPEA